MIADRDTDRILRGWFQETPAPLPEHVLDAVLEGLPRVQQRRGWVLPEPSFAASRSVLRLAIVVAALITLVVGLLLVAGGGLTRARPS